MLVDAVLVGSLVVLVMIAVPLLGRRYPRARPAVTASFRAWIWGTGLVVLALTPVVGLARLQLSVLPRLSVRLQVLILIVWGLLLALGLFVISTATRRQRLFEALGRFGFLVPPIYSAGAGHPELGTAPGLRRRPRRPARAGVQGGGHPARAGRLHRLLGLAAGPAGGRGYRIWMRAREGPPG
jgi:hypothetical protein